MAAMKIAVNARGGNAARTIFCHEMILVSPRNQSCTAASRLALATPQIAIRVSDVGSCEPTGIGGLKEE
jgi:hypothetical protein